MRREKCSHHCYTIALPKQNVNGFLEKMKSNTVFLAIIAQAQKKMHDEKGDYKKLLHHAHILDSAHPQKQTVCTFVVEACYLLQFAADSVVDWFLVFYLALQMFVAVVVLQ